MADDITETAPEQKPQQPEEGSRAQERITQLSEKVKTEAEAKEAALKEKADADRRALFAEGYADFVTAHPAAQEFKDQIREKVNAGMSVDDAGYAILGKAGKLNAPKAEPQNPAGGSAATVLPGNPTKSPGEMTQAERRAELEKMLQWT